MSLPPLLTLPLLAREALPTQTDLRAIMRWTNDFETWIATLESDVATLQAHVATLQAQVAAFPHFALGHVQVGSNIPPSTPLTWRVDSAVVSASGGIASIGISGFSVGYNVIVTPGDNAGGLGTVVPVLGSSSLTTLTVALYTPTGAALSGACRFNYQIVGA